MRGGYELLKDPGQQPAPSPKRSTVLAVLICGTIFLSTFYAFAPKVHSPDDSTCSQVQPTSPSAAEDLLAPQKPLEQCATSTPQAAKAPAPVNLWSSLTVNETVIIHNWLNEPARGLNLTSAETAALSDNIIFHIEAYRPSKSDALRYLESPSEDNLPERYARVTIHHAARKTEDGGPVIKDYLVGPLPVGQNMSMRELTEIYHREDIPYNARGFAIPTEITSLLASYMPRLAEATKVCVPRAPYTYDYQLSHS